jgi:hypothetical protein
MTKHRLEVADIFRRYQADFLQRFGSVLSTDQRRVLNAIMACRTSVLGGHASRCDHCGHKEISYNSCRNRHCPKCQAMARAAWMEAREAELLPIPYFHAVFTLPRTLAPLALQNKRIVYGILFQAAAETLKEVAANPKHLGAEIGVLAVLHTWGQNLMHHPHLHCVVTGGGIASDRSRWVHCKRSRKRKPFFAPVRILSRVFRGKFIDSLKQAFRKGRLEFHGQLASLREEPAFEKLLDVSVRTDWIVYAKRPFGGPERVLKYLARYTHRVAISNQRLTSMHDGRVQLRWKDYADHARQKTMELDAMEFMRRFLLHVLPAGFVRIRHYGFLANRHRHEKLALCRRLLDVSPNTDGEAAVSVQQSDSADEPVVRCPACGEGRMIIIEVVEKDVIHVSPRRPFMLSLPRNTLWDSS